MVLLEETSLPTRSTRCITLQAMLGFRIGSPNVAITPNTLADIVGTVREPSSFSLGQGTCLRVLVTKFRTTTDKAMILEFTERLARHVSRTSQPLAFIASTVAPHLFGSGTGKAVVIVALLAPFLRGNTRKDVHCLLHGPKRSGKTTLLRTVKTLSPWAMFLDGNNVTVSDVILALAHRATERTTLVIDNIHRVISSDEVVRVLRMAVANHSLPVSVIASAPSTGPFNSANLPQDAMKLFNLASGMAEHLSDEDAEAMCMHTTRAQRFDNQTEYKIQNLFETELTTAEHAEERGTVDTNVYHFLQLQFTHIPCTLLRHYLCECRTLLLDEMCDATLSSDERRLHNGLLRVHRSFSKRYRSVFHVSAEDFERFTSKFYEIVAVISGREHVAESDVQVVGELLRDGPFFIPAQTNDVSDWSLRSVSEVCNLLVEELQETPADFGSFTFRQKTLTAILKAHRCTHVRPVYEALCLRGFLTRGPYKNEFNFVHANDR